MKISAKIEDKASIEITISATLTFETWDHILNNLPHTGYAHEYLMGIGAALSKIRENIEMDIKP